MEVIFGSPLEMLGKAIRWKFILSETKDEVLKMLKDTINSHEDCDYDNKEHYAEYFYEIEEERITFKIDIYIVINAFIEKFEKQIKEIMIENMAYYFRMKSIQYLGDACYYSKLIKVYERWNPNREICRIKDCRFYGLFDNPLNRKAALREGTLFMKEKDCHMKFLFEPLLMRHEESAGVTTCYDGVISVFYMGEDKILTIKGIFEYDGDGPVVTVRRGSRDVLERALRYLNCCMVNPKWIRSIDTYGEPWPTGMSLCLRTQDGENINYSLREFPEALRDFNDFLRFRSIREKNVWDEIIAYVRSFCPEPRKFTFWRSNTAIQLKCNLDCNRDITFTLDFDNNVKEYINSATVIIYDEEQKVMLHLRLPYLYGEEKHELAMYPISIMLFFDDKYRRRILLSGKNRRMQKVARFLKMKEWSVSDLCGGEPYCTHNVQELNYFLLETNREIPNTEMEPEPVNRGDIIGKVRKILAEDESFQVGEDIIRNICITSTQYLSWKFQKSINVNQPSPFIPNYVFLGGPGSGKSSLVRKLAKDVFEAKFYETTPSELMGLYIGHTRGVFLEKLNELQNQKGYGPDAPAILFLDEAYTLFAENGHNNAFVQDIMGVLLTVMQRKKQRINYQIEKYDEEGRQKTLNRSIVIKPNTVIWMAGYEKVMRKALSANQGIFRRVKAITLPEPTVEELWERFECIAQSAGEENQKLFQEKKAEILKYFRWGVSMEHAEFFGNYSGAKRLAENMVNVLLLMGQGSSMEEKGKELEAVLDEQKREIRRQYQVVIRKNERLPFEIVSDLKETLSDYIGNEPVMEQMNEIVDMMVDAEFYQKRHISIPKGALLMGCPGTGKTYLAKCMAGELSKRLQERNISRNIAFIPVAATELNSAELISCLFRTAEEYEAAIIFIDEIDAIGKKRKLLSQDGALIQLMKEMDGFDERKAVFILAATNEPDILDPALKRAGRFDMQFEIGYPNLEERKSLIQYYGKELIGTFREEILEEAGRVSSGYAPADIREIMNETALLYYRCENRLAADMEHSSVVYMHRAVREGENINGAEKILIAEKEYWKSRGDETADGREDVVLQQDLFLRDFKEILVKKSLGERQISDSETEEFQCSENTGRSSVAVHEMGHALICAWQKVCIEKITVLARNVANGYVGMAPTLLRTKNDILKQIKIALGGRAAEEIMYGGDISVGACNDLHKATELTRNMVAKYGMGDKMGVISLMTENGRYLGKEDSYTCSLEYRKKADEEIQKILEEQYKEVKEYLLKEKENLCRMAEYIFHKEEVSGQDFQMELLRSR